MLLAGSELERSLHESEIGIVRHHRFRERGELDPQFGEFRDFLNHFLHRTFPAIEHGTDLYGTGFDDDQLFLPEYGLGPRGPLAAHTAC
jgi:hypothetical protein